MIRILVVLFFCRSGLSILQSRRSSYHTELGVIGGNDTKIEDFPYQASLEYEGVHICGAVLIDANILITAAHCTLYKKAEKMKIRLGSKTIPTGGKSISVRHIKTHPDFYLGDWRYDIAMLWLEHPVQYGPKIFPIDLPNPFQKQKSGTNVVAIGWGMLHRYEKSKVLQFVDLIIINKNDCNSTYGGRLNDSMLCAAALDPMKSTCVGDDGGPLVANRTLVGITSYGTGCSTDLTPLIFTDVAIMRNWIAQTIEDNPRYLDVPLGSS